MPSAVTWVVWCLNPEPRHEAEGAARARPLALTSPANLWDNSSGRSRPLETPERFLYADMAAPDRETDPHDMEFIHHVVTGKFFPDTSGQGRQFFRGNLGFCRNGFVIEIAQRFPPLSAQAGPRFRRPDFSLFVTGQTLQRPRPTPKNRHAHDLFLFFVVANNYAVPSIGADGWAWFINGTIQRVRFHIVVFLSDGRGSHRSCESRMGTAFFETVIITLSPHLQYAVCPDSTAWLSSCSRRGRGASSGVGEEGFYGYLDVLFLRHRGDSKDFDL